MGGMRFWHLIYIFDRKMESILNELKKYFFDFRIYFNVLRARARMLCVREVRVKRAWERHGCECMEAWM